MKVKSVNIGQIIDCIEYHQPVLNKQALLANELSDISIESIARLDDANEHSLSFLSDMSYQHKLTQTKAGVILVDEANVSCVPLSAVAIVVPSPYLAYACVSQLMEKIHQAVWESTQTFGAIFDVGSSAKTKMEANAKIHPTAIIGEGVQIGQDVSIGAYSVIESYAMIGDGTVIGSQVMIGCRACIGRRCVLFAQVVIAHDCQLGDDCRVHSHASIGSEGFGFAPIAHPSQEDCWKRIAQLGRVLIGNRVRIGSHTCIDRGAIDDTIIADDVIIDNLVQIAHNVQIGKGTAIAANTGIAGSSIIGKGCIIGGAVGIVGHIKIADFVTLTARTFVTKSIHQSGSYSSGTVAMPTAQWRRAAVKFRQISD